MLFLYFPWLSHFGRPFARMKLSDNEFLSETFSVPPNYKFTRNNKELRVCSRELGGGLESFPLPALVTPHTPPAILP